MAPYDSDSDSEGGESFTETSVLLGYASKEATDDTTSQLGGYPTWLDSATPPNGALAKCKVCNNFLTLLLQLNGDLPERFPGHERRLYLFGCRRKTCRRKEGSVRGFRAVRASHVPEAAATATAQQQQSKKTQQEEAPVAPPKQSHIGESLFGVKPASSSSSSAQTNPFSARGPSSSSTANPFASKSSPLNPFAGASSLAAKPPQQPVVESAPAPSAPATPSLTESFASKARITSPEPSSSLPAAPIGPVEPWPQQSALPPAYPSYYLDADYETLDSTPLAIPANARVTDMEIEGGDSGSGSANTDDTSNKAVFESAMDTQFQKFADRLAQNPEQVLRYEFAGSPLLYDKNDAVGKKLASVHDNGNVKVQQVKSGMPRCANCGADRVFEVQLTPHAITELEAEELGIEGMEWGTVILGVCGKDCVARGVGQGEVGYVEEFVAVQWEEQVSRK